MSAAAKPAIPRQGRHDGRLGPGLRDLFTGAGHRDPLQDRPVGKRRKHRNAVNASAAPTSGCCLGANPITAETVLTPQGENPGAARFAPVRRCIDKRNRPVPRFRRIDAVREVLALLRDIRKAAR
jgi:hypothetical protein